MDAYHNVSSRKIVILLIMLIIAITMVSDSRIRNEGCYEREFNEKEGEI